MRTHRRVTIAGLGAALAALGLASFLVLGPLAMPDRHRDGEGALASTNQVDTVITAAVDPSAAARRGVTSWSFGMPLCLARGDQAAIIESIAPGQSVGTGYRFLGARVRTFTTVPGNQGIAGVDGFPPSASVVPDALHEIAGYAVSTPCETAVPGTTITELIVGLAATGPDGGGWKGVDVSYNLDGRHHVLATTYGFLVCGPSDLRWCRGSPSPSP